MGFLRWLLLLSLAAWIGAILFFSAVVAPMTFQHFPKPMAAEVAGLYLPRYYLFGSVCGIVALSTILLLQALAKRTVTGIALTTLLIAVMLGANLYTGMVVQPKAHALRTHVDATTMTTAPTPESPAITPATAAAEPSVEFKQLHRLAMQLNAATLLLGLVALGFLSSRLHL